MTVADTPMASPPSSWTRVKKTPLRDLVRLRLTGRLDIDQRLTPYALPDEARDVVHDVVRRTRLWRLEKADVAEELATHFADGLDGGRSTPELIDAFGDPGHVAKLIRRAKRRRRPLPWRIMRWTGFALAGVAALYLLLGVRFWFGRPQPRTDYVAMLGATAAAVPEDDRAWPIYRAALLDLESSREVLQPFNRPPFPGEDGWDVFAAYLTRQADALDLARTAAGKAGLGYVPTLGIPEEDRALFPELASAMPSETNLVIGIVVPYLAELRKLARTLAWDAQRAAAEGNGELVLANLAAMIGVAEHSRETSFLIGDLVAYSILTSASETTRDLLAHHPDVMTDAQLVELAHRLSQTDDILTVRLEGERMMYDDFMQHVYTDDGDGNGRLTREGLGIFQQMSGGADSTPEHAALLAAMPALDFVILDRKDMTEAYERIFAQYQREAQLPLWERGRSEAETQIETWSASTVDRIRYFPITVLMPALSKVGTSCELAIAQRDASLVVIAMELYRRAHGTWPETLETIPTTLLPQVPLDRFDGQPLRYALRDDGSAVLYSIGTDRVDDGGETASRRKFRTNSPTMRWIPAEDLPTAKAVVNGDWVLWPSERGFLFRETTDG